MPVGTRGAIKYLSADDYTAVGAQIVLGNTYHLMLRPGAETVAHFGGLAKFAGWDGLTLTDSGGFQVFSLEPKVDDDGVTFQSTYDGSSHRFTPESAVAPGLLVPTFRWCSMCPHCRAARGRATGRGTHGCMGRAQAHNGDQALFGSSRWGERGLRGEATRPSTRLRRLRHRQSVGRETRQRCSRRWRRRSPNCWPALSVGVGDPASMVGAVNLGIDNSCVMRTGWAVTEPLTSRQVNLKRSEYTLNDEPIDMIARVRSRSTSRVTCGICSRSLNRPSRLVSMHNVAWTIGLMGQVRAAIEAGGFSLGSDPRRVGMMSPVGDRS
jgi:queuine tRNA-ribosyltransferase